jgi:hypothetical protein
MFRKDTSVGEGGGRLLVGLGVGFWVPDEASTVFVGAEGTEYAKCTSESGWYLELDHGVGRQPGCASECECRPPCMGGGRKGNLGGILCLTWIILDLLDSFAGNFPIECIPGVKCSHSPLRRLCLVPLISKYSDTNKITQKYGFKISLGATRVAKLQKGAREGTVW